MPKAVASAARWWCRIGRCALLAFGLGACATTSDRSFWGADATIAPGWDRLGRAAVDAAKDPFTWAPAVGAAALQIGDLDNEIADWANEETPLFGSRGTASDASDWLRNASVAIYAGTGLGAPAPRGGWLGAKAKGFAVGAAAVGTTIGATTLLKEVSDRERPLGQDDGSFVSGHASLTSASARLTSEVLRYYDMSQGARIAANTGLASLALTTGWARVEAGEHHPADVLAGAALGNFLAVFATEAFLRDSLGESVMLQAFARRDGVKVGLSITF
ncbi:phosphatase PAP2 family protein [Dongia deserti]|uniref:phosphatase PAP2 family protein n=1 Tax=Dongia deserti TaxID=2268030 RepID=UPI000E6512B9|nr:phosphatase PAP2 family protein [Dongia deserti]